MILFIFKNSSLEKKKSEINMHIVWKILNINLK